MRFYDTSVILFPRDGTRVQWRVEPESTDLSTIEVEVQRSGAPSGPWDLLQTVDPESVFSFVDKTVPWRPKNWEIYYRLVGKLRSTGAVVYAGLPFGMQGELPLDALEIIRQHRLLLEGVNGHPSFSGVPCTVYKKRTFGARCRECTDAVTKQVVIAQCRACGGSGFANGGYFDPIDVAVSWTPHPRFTQISPMMKLEDNETMAFMVNYPIMSSEDVIVEPNERHWRVVNMTPTERKRVVVHQNLRLAQVDHNDVIYETLRHSSHRS